MILFPPLDCMYIHNLSRLSLQLTLEKLSCQRHKNLSATAVLQQTPLDLNIVSATLTGKDGVCPRRGDLGVRNKGSTRAHDKVAGVRNAGSQNVNILVHGSQPNRLPEECSHREGGGDHYYGAEEHWELYRKFVHTRACP